ncbi:MAG: twin-arginine translocation signal domain-containing protein [Gallionella sp.]|nr:twin-arginine translocation signal domain-containing protein [Gallionella sp.]
MKQEENSRRAFFKKAAAAVGVVATAGFVSKAISPKAEVTAEEARLLNARDAVLQERAVKSNKMTLMSEDEKHQRLNDLLACHKQETA